MKIYFRPLVQTGAAKPSSALNLAGSACWFTHVEVLQRQGAAEILPVSVLPAEVRVALCGTRPSIAGLRFDAPRVMGILNLTPDSFYDGGQFKDSLQALTRAREMITQGADILDIGGESTRPGALEIDREVEITRTAPVIAAIRRHENVPISIDTRKAAVAEAAGLAGADLVNDVSGFTFDSALAALCRDRAMPVIVMHAQGIPQTMQEAPHYDNVLLDVFDFLQQQITGLTALGLARSQIIVDPGIGFGKTLTHNLALLQRLSLFHGLGVPVLLGASRKGFIGAIGKASKYHDRLPGSIAVALEALAQGVQIVRVHDVAETRQAIDLWQALKGAAGHGT